MNISDRRLKAGLRADADDFIREEHLLETIEKSKAAFYEGEASGMLSRAGFVCLQSRYIRKRCWILQACVLLLLWMLLDAADGGVYIRRCTGAAAPLFAVLVLPELWKNKSAGATEVEGSTRYCLRQVYAARMFWLALVDTLLLAAFALAALAAGRLTPWEIIVNFFLPYVITCCISFRTLYSKKIGSESFALLLCVVFGVVWMQLILNEKIYAAIAPPAWFAAFSVSVFYLGVCIYRGQKNYRQFLEVQPLWN